MPSGTSFSSSVGRVLEIAVARAVALRHRAERAHAAVGLVRGALVQLDLARRFLGAREQPADHHACAPAAIALAMSPE